MTSADTMTVLDRDAVSRSLELIDPVETIESALLAHANGATVLPPEAYLAWENSQGAYSRSLAMLGGLMSGEPPLYGVKVVNAATSNPARGIERAGGVIMLFDSETARPSLLAEAGLVSALRTAAYTMSSILHLGPPEVSTISILGCGTLAQRHLDLARRFLPDLRGVSLYDVVPERATAMAAWATRILPGIAVSVAPGARECVRAGDVLVTTTVSDRPYISDDWIDQPTFVAHVSLDDVDRSVFLAAEGVFVDDLDLVVDNPRRVLGALIRDGEIAPAPQLAGPSIHGTLGEVLAGRVEPIRPSTGNVVSNPFGMAILDVALIARVRQVAQEAELGFALDLVGESR